MRAADETPSPPGAGPPATAAPDERTREEVPSGRGLVLAGLMLTMGLAAMDSTIVATAIPSVVRDLGGFAQFAWVFSIYLLTQAVSVPVYGKLADTFGRKPMLLAGTLIFLAGSMLCGIAWNMTTLIVFRGIQGLGAGAIIPISTTVVGDIYTVRERAAIQGWLSSVWGVAAVVGPAIGGFLAQYASWRWIFYINLPLGAAALVMVNTHLHEKVVRHRHRVDVEGAVLVMAGTALLILGLLEGGVDWAWASAQSFTVFVLAAMAWVAFVLVERRAAEPIVPRFLFRRRLLVGANLAMAAVGTIVIGLSTFLPTFAQGVLGATPVVAGFALAAMSIGWPLASAGAGRLYLRLGFRDTALIGMVLCTGAGAGFGLLSESSPVVVAGALSFVMGVGLGLVSTSVIVGIQSVVGWGHRGVVTGGAMFTRQLGSSIGAAVFGSIANAALASWFAAAPTTVRAHLPASPDAAASILGGEAGVPAAAAAFVRHGLFLGSQRVFTGIAVVAVAGIVVLLVTPRRFRTLDL